MYRAKTVSEEKATDFRFDQYRWISKGNNTNKKRKNQPCVLMRYYFIKDPQGSGKDSLPDFKRVVIFLRNTFPEERILYMLHYIRDKSLFKESKHGNRKKIYKLFVPVKKSVIENIKEKQGPPINIYKSMQNKAAESNLQMRMPVDRPRDLKQVENTLHSVRKTGKITNDEIFSLFELAIHLGTFI